ncbi:MAG: pentapeptide repeat-containing protein [Gemmatimonadales bacterium]
MAEPSRDPEVVVEPSHTSPADRQALPPRRSSADAAARGNSIPLAPHDLAAELRAHGSWRATSLGPSPDLSGADLSGEDLRGVDFRGARLQGASFANADLVDAQFAWARLAHADFTGASGLLGSQFARADLRGSRMPSSVRFGAFETANEMAEGTGKLFLTVLLICAYSWLTINSTVDRQLLTDTAVSKLPILNADIPIVNFYALVPIALVGLAVIALLQAQRLWSAIAAAPESLPDGTAMADRASVWLLGPWAAERLVPPHQAGALARLQAWLAIIVGWWIVPGTVAWFWGRYLHRHDWTVTWIQIVALTVGCTAAAGFLSLAVATLPRRYLPAVDNDTASSGRAGQRARWWRRLRPYAPTLSVALMVPIAFGGASYAAIHGVHRPSSSGAVLQQTSNVQPALSLVHAVPALQSRVPEIMSHFGMRSVAQLAEAEISTRLTTGATADTGLEAKASGAHLVGADLRFASGERAYLALSDLRRADLLGADLWSADLRGANLTGASVVGSLLFNTDMRKLRAGAGPAADRSDTAAGVAYVDTLFCSRTFFSGSNLRYARFSRADVRGAAFNDGMLQGAVFAGARLHHATFDNADLDGADFRGAYGLTPSQILAAHHVEALYDPQFLDALKVQAPDRFLNYDSTEIAAETERERLSGELEPDSLDAHARHSRNSVIRMAFDIGVPEPPSQTQIDTWAARGHVAPGSIDAVPYGCVMSRTTREASRPAGRSRPAS